MSCEARRIAKHIIFRLVDVSDAEFILALRSDRMRNRYLSPVTGGVGAQRTWIQHYKQREARNDEFYFIIATNDLDALGAVRLYDFTGDSFCWGSWILRPDAPPYAALESAIVVYELAFYQYGFRRTHFDVRRENKKVVNFHLRFGAEIIAKDDLNYYFSFDERAYSCTKKKFRKFFFTNGEPIRTTSGS